LNTALASSRGSATIEQQDGRSAKIVKQGDCKTAGSVLCACDENRKIDNKRKYFDLIQLS